MLPSKSLVCSANRKSAFRILRLYLQALKAQVNNGKASINLKWYNEFSLSSGKMIKSARILIRVQPDFSSCEKDVLFPEMFSAENVNSEYLTEFTEVLKS